MKLVVLERNSAGTDVDMSCFEQFGAVTYHANSTAENVAQRICGADIVICACAVSLQKDSMPSICSAIMPRAPTFFMADMSRWGITQPSRHIIHPILRAYSQ